MQLQDVGRLIPRLIIQFLVLTFLVLTSLVLTSLVLTSDAGATSLLVSSRAGSGGAAGVVRYDAQTGAFLGVFASHPDLINPMGLAIGPDGNLYVSEHIDAQGLAGKIMRFDGQSGTFIDTFIQGGQLEGPLDLTFGPDGNLYVGSRFNNLVLAYNGTTGAAIGIFGDASGPNSGLADPFGLTFDPAGNLYVSTYAKDRLNESLSAVLRYDATGASLPSPLFTGAHFADPDVVAPPAGFPDLSLEDHILPVDLTFGPDGNLYVLSVVGDGVLRFDAGTGEFIDTFVLGSELNNPRGLEFGPDGDLYVASFTDRSVLRFDGLTGAFDAAFLPTGTEGLGEATNMLFVTIPEPTTAILLASGLVAISLANKRTRGRHRRSRG